MRNLTETIFRLPGQGFPRILQHLLAEWPGVENI